MRRKRIVLDVTSKNSIDKTIRYLEWLKNDLPKQCEKFCLELAEVGIHVAVARSGASDLANYVIFSKEVKLSNSNETVVVMFGKDAGQVFGEGSGHQEISPILMLEYGSGFEGAPPQSLLDGQIYVGQGSFPNQTHAFDPNGWFYRDKNGKLQHSFGETAQYPIQTAYDYMVTQVDEVMKRVFTL